jgi:chaperonin GroES
MPPLLVVILNTIMAKKKKSTPKRKSAPKVSVAENTSPVQPLLDRVLVKREDIDMTSPSGIIIPDTAQKEKSKRGVVVAVGTGRVTDDGKVIPMSVKIGTKVFFNSGWDNEVKIDGEEEEYFLVRESDILAVIK